MDWSAESVEVRVVDHVPSAFAALVVEAAPRSLALSGGDTARRCYELLAVADVAWGEVSIWFGDERWVPVDDPNSNEGMARHAFIDQVDPSAVHSMRHAGATIEEAAQAYDDLVAAAPPIDLVHLGLGPDGHTASLFPGSAALAESERFVVTNGDALHPHPRLTFTYPALTRARLLVFTVAGPEKREAFERVRAADDLPAARADADRIVWLVDEAAFGGSELTRS
ncbi:MAG: 6-phosphogluconolactonase [Acidimicrobiia bacterium]